jgi:hypothetical protein
LRRPGRGWEGRFIVARGPRRTRRGGVCIRRALRTLIACERWLAKHRRRSRRGCERLRRAWRRLEVRELARRRSGRGAVRRLEVCLNVTWRSSRGRESRRCALRWGSDIFGRRGYLQVLKRGQIWFKLLRRWWVWMKVLGRWVVLMRILGKTSARWLRDRVKGFSRRLRNRIKSSNRSVMNQIKSRGRFMRSRAVIYRKYVCILRPSWLVDMTTLKNDTNGFIMEKLRIS